MTWKKRSRGQGSKTKATAGTSTNREWTEEELEDIRDQCRKELRSIQTPLNKFVIDHFINELLPQLKPNLLIPIWIGLCPTPVARGHESLGGKGRVNGVDDDHAATIRYMRFLDACLPAAFESGGILPHSWWINSREICTNDGVTCTRCKEYSDDEAKDIGAALAVISKYVRLAGGRIVAMCMAGISDGVKADKLFTILKRDGQFDGLSEYGTHASFLGSKCLSWDRDEQEKVVRATLYGADLALQSSFEAIGFTPERTLLKTAEMTPELRYVTPREEDMTDEEKAELREALTNRDRTVPSSIHSRSIIC